MADPRREAYEAALASGNIPACRRIIYDDLYLHGDSTAREVLQRTKLPQAILNRSRFNELEQQGVLARVGLRNDGLTPSDTETTVWRWLPNLPTKYVKKVGPKEQVTILLSAIAEATDLKELQEFVVECLDEWEVKT